MLGWYKPEFQLPMQCAAALIAGSCSCLAGTILKSNSPCRAPKGCPCTPQLLCQTDERGIFNEFCDIPRAPVATYSMHGGAGGIMSVGLLRAVSLNFMDMCIKSLYSTGMSLESSLIS